MWWNVLDTGLYGLQREIVWLSSRTHHSRRHDPLFGNTIHFTVSLYSKLFFWLRHTTSWTPRELGKLSSLGAMEMELWGALTADALCCDRALPDSLSASGTQRDRDFRIKVRDGFRRVVFCSFSGGRARLDLWRQEEKILCLQTLLESEFLWYNFFVRDSEPLTVRVIFIDIRVA